MRQFLPTAKDSWVSLSPPMKTDKELIKELKDEIKSLKSEIIDLLDEIMREKCLFHSGGPRGGWWDSMAITYTCHIGDRLVELGLWERHPDGVGRRWFYRPIANENVL